MSTHSEKLKVLEGLNEAEFRSDILVPLISRMENCEQVRERHGPIEYGKDITFCQTSALGNTYVAVVAKIGTIGGGTSGKQNLENVRTEVNMAFDMTYNDVETKQEHKINRVIVWTTGTISNNAEEQIIRSITDKYRNIDFKNGQATIELLEKYYPGFFTIRDPSIADYYGTVKKSYSRLEELRTLGYSSERHQLSTLFVQPVFSEFVRKSPKGKPQGSHKKTGTKKYLFEHLSSIRENAVIIGESGTGKTTLLRRLLIQIIEENENLGQKTPIPVLIEFKRIDLSLNDPINKELDKELTRFNPQGITEKLSSNLPDGSFVLLIDGLDELKETETITNGIERVLEFTNSHPKTRIFITSRIIDVIHKPGLLPGFKILKINELDTQQMVKFVENWFGKDSNQGLRLISYINKPSSLHGLPQTPLVLSIIAILFERGTREIPANLTELFQKYTELALGRWDVSKDISLQFEWKIKEFILRKIAWGMQLDDKFDISKSELLEKIQEYDSERGLGINIGICFKELIERSELLLLNWDNKYEFRHKFFRDYFVGLEISQQDEQRSLIVDNFLSPQWSMPIFFAGGLNPDNEDYIRDVLENVIPPEDKKYLYVVNLGFLLQSKYLIPKQIKKTTVQKIVSQLIQTWDILCKTAEEYHSQHPEEIEIPHFFCLAFFLGFPNIALGSITLSQTLSELVENYISDISSLTGDDRVVLEWELICLAMGCAGCDNVEDIITIFGGGIITDPVFWLVGSYYTEDMSKRSWLDQNDRKRLEVLSNKLNAKNEKHKKYLSDLMKNKPIPLNIDKDIIQKLTNGED